MAGVRMVPSQPSALQVTWPGARWGGKRMTAANKATFDSRGQCPPRVPDGWPSAPSPLPRPQEQVRPRLSVFKITLRAPAKPTPAAPRSCIFLPFLSLAFHHDHERQRDKAMAPLSEVTPTEPPPYADRPTHVHLCPLTTATGGACHCVPVLEEDTEAQIGEPKPLS